MKLEICCSKSKQSTFLSPGLQSSLVRRFFTFCTSLRGLFILYITGIVVWLYIALLYITVMRTKKWSECRIALPLFTEKRIKNKFLLIADSIAGDYDNSGELHYS